MTVKIGYTEGFCSRCGSKLSRPRPADLAVCDCWEYCPIDHGNGPYGTRMEPYTPDLTLQAYGPINSVKAYGNLQHPLNIVMWCPICQYYSAQKPVEVKLT